MLIEVTQDDIEAGKKHDSDSCPVALAAARVFNGPCKAGCFTMETPNGGRVNMPRSVYYFMINFDKGFPVEPFSFEVN